eukprot:6503178-Prorocentrum_lima.AAC.1
MAYEYLRARLMESPPGQWLDARNSWETGIWLYPNQLPDTPPGLHPLAKEGNGKRRRRAETRHANRGLCTGKDDRPGNSQVCALRYGHSRLL